MAYPVFCPWWLHDAAGVTIVGRTARCSREPHAGDWRPGDPTWKGELGKNIIGALNYLAAIGMNSVYFLTYNTDGGDGRDVWPWISPSIRDRYDVSKLDQWNIVFSHMDRLGLQLHVVLQEEENDQVLDGGALGVVRKLYYRELIARFGHHLALLWNLGEENTNTDAQRRAFAEYIREVDPYDHPITFHTWMGRAESVYTPFLGHPSFEAVSAQDYASSYNTRAISLRKRSRDAGRPWAIYGDEQSPALTSDMRDLDTLRQQALWGNLMGGGAGVEWLFAYESTFGDVQSDDWRVAEPLWNQTRHALDFFQTYLPFESMEPSNGLVSGATKAFVLAKPGQVYAVYFPAGGSGSLDLGAASGTYDVYWYNPRTGGPLGVGTVATVHGSGIKALGLPPGDPSRDWTVLVRQR